MLPSSVTISLNRGDSRTLPVQLADRIRTAIDNRQLAEGDRLPSSRALSAQMGVARGVVENAYEQLSAEGWLEAKRARARTSTASVPPRTTLHELSHRYPGSRTSDPFRPRKSVSQPGRRGSPPVRPRPGDGPGARRATRCPRRRTRTRGENPNCAPRSHGYSGAPADFTHIRTPSW